MHNLFRDSFCTESQAGIYSIINRVNLKIYIGSARNLAGRKRGHKWQLRKGNHHSPYLQRAVNHSPESFEFSVIERVENPKDLIEREQFWINFYRSYIPSNGYNICRIANSSAGTTRGPQSPEVRARHSAATKLAYLEGRMKPAWRGKKLSSEHRLAISIANKGKQFTLGHVMSDAHREKIRAKMLGRHFTDEWKRKISAAKKGIAPLPHVLAASAKARKKSVVAGSLAAIPLRKS